MKQVPTFKIRKVTPLTDAQLLRRLIELKKLRERVRMAEVAMKPRTDVTLARHHWIYQNGLLTAFAAVFLFALFSLRRWTIDRQEAACVVSASNPSGFPLAEISAIIAEWLRQKTKLRLSPVGKDA